MKRALTICTIAALLAGWPAVSSVSAGVAQAASSTSHWSTAKPQHSPPVDASSMVFDDATGQLVRFGTSYNDQGCPPDITWTWDGGDWADHQQVNAPPDRQWPTMGYDAATKQVVMFGGNSPKLRYASWPGGIYRGDRRYLDVERVDLVRAASGDRAADAGGRVRGLRRADAAVHHVRRLCTVRNGSGQP